MQIEYLLHGILIRLGGAESLKLDCSSPCTVQDALNALAEHCPALEQELQRSACAIGDALINRSETLPSNCQLALIPPVSGGQPSYPHLTDEALDLAALLDETADDSCGALAVFGGTVRIDNDNQEVKAIDYSAYEPLAVKALRDIEAETITRFGVQQCRLSHRTGKLQLGELSVLVVIRAGHRPEAFEAARWAIDTLKERVPVWKNEHYADGTSEYLPGHSLGQANNNEST